MDTKKSVQLRNLLIAAATILLVGGLYGATRADFSRVTPAQMVERSIPYETAQTNGRPTLIEFYADWCATCKLMNPTVAKLERQYEGKFNFVMLNVDNPKWNPELDRYRVNGIPHYVFLAPDGTIQGNVIGEQTADLFGANLAALVQGQSLPYARPTPGQVSTFKTRLVPPQVQPRAHSNS
ncbi:thioredoxin domain-containing protein [Candidatus Cyanaurora vandensis]|uniref:thioredoxin domain-containing protein n=1 Tax=Candidatus Cyanaurora vandensis TaxID=2714958 RepID=UPI00257A2E69|nr:thioredoxin domain-containing protein [Candidatus Cyanaurora vandensis]